MVGAKADLVDDPVAAAALLGEEALPVSAMTGKGVDDLLQGLGPLTREAIGGQPERQPYVVLRPGRPRFTVTASRTVVGG